ncbi:HAUS augmin-like complex subunit 6 N-terminus-domain-containing protein [Umbelopsis sp. AD052]|nr:HAUS augmin-like complex subunit 6 N-terminus-domain-containing protein [Umbelopsis sp. AD052]
MSNSQTSPRHILAENLSILGFKPKNNTNSHYSGVIVNQDAFSGANNTKAFELMSWFLFNKLDAHKAKKVFAHCWPIEDYRSQPREYRSVAYKWLEELKKENRLVGDIVLRRSYFEDCRGERIEKIMMALSTLVLKSMMERSQEYLDEPMIALNSNDSSTRRLMELEEATMKANKIVAKLEARHQQFKLNSETKQRTIKQKLERLDSYQFGSHHGSEVSIYDTTAFLKTMIKSPTVVLPPPPASEATKPTIKYDRNGRRIRPAAEEVTYETTTQNKTLHAKAPIDKSGSSGVKTSSTPNNERLFKENRGGKSVHTKHEVTHDKPTRSLTPGLSLCDEIVNQVNKPPLSMITPPRSYSPKTISSRGHDNFESPSYSKFREYKRKLSAAADTSVEAVEPSAPATSQASIHMSPILSNNIGRNFDSEDGDRNIFEGFQKLGAHSTPQKPSFLESGVNRSILSTAYNAAIDDTSVYLFGEVLPENFDDGVDMTL